MHIFKFLARSVLAITLAGVAAKANAQSIDELYQAAKKEGALSLNGGGPAGLYEVWVQEFEQRIGFLFQRFGTSGVFVFIALAMFAVVISVRVFGPRTRGLTLEQIPD